MSAKDAIFKLLGIPTSGTIRNLKGALKLSQEFRDPDDRLTAVVQDYPLLVDLARAYARHGEWESAQDIVRVCFNVRDEYSEWSGKREVFLLRRVVQELANSGREDIAEHILKKIQNFESGIAVDALSSTHIEVDREELDRLLRKRDRNKES